MFLCSINDPVCETTIIILKNEATAHNGQKRGRDQMKMIVNDSFCAFKCLDFGLCLALAHPN